jgi:D-lactate dehydrogenase (cytochrome)
MTSYRGGAKVVVTDVFVPISRLAECIPAAKQEIERNRLIAPVVGHVGDGNFHAGVMVMSDPDEVARAKAFIEWLAEFAIAADGTCTGEHGIGGGSTSSGGSMEEPRSGSCVCSSARSHAIDFAN